MGKLSKIKAELSKILTKLAEVKSDKGILSIDGEIAENVNVNVVDENGNLMAAEDGDYVLEDERTITVKDGKVVAIKEKEVAEEKPAEEETKAEEEKPAEEKPVEEKPVEEKPAEEMPVDVDDDKALAEIMDMLKRLMERMDNFEAELGCCKDKLGKCETKMSEIPAAKSFEAEIQPKIEAADKKIARIKAMFE